MIQSKVCVTIVSKIKSLILIECMTFRMRGHEEASGTKYVPQELFEEWELKDPIKNYENYLVEARGFTVTAGRS